MKPTDGTFAVSTRRWGVAGLHIDGARIPSGEDHRRQCESVVGLNSNRDGMCYGGWAGAWTSSRHPGGRWPSNVALDAAAAALLDQQAGSAGDHDLRGRGAGKRPGGFADVGAHRLGVPLSIVWREIEKSLVASRNPPFGR